MNASSSWLDEISALRKKVTHFGNNSLRSNLKSENVRAILNFVRVNKQFMKEVDQKSAFQSYAKLLSTLEYLLVGGGTIPRPLATGRRGIEAIATLLDVVAFQLNFSLSQERVILELTTKNAQLMDLVNNLRAQNEKFDTADNVSIAETESSPDMQSLRFTESTESEESDEFDDRTFVNPTSTEVGLSTSLLSIMVRENILSVDSANELYDSFCELISSGGNAKSSSTVGPILEACAAAARTAKFEAFNNRGDDICPLGSGFLFKITLNDKIWYLRTERSNSLLLVLFCGVVAVATVTNYTVYYHFSNERLVRTIDTLLAHNASIEVISAALDSKSLAPPDSPAGALRWVVGAGKP